MPIAPKPKFGTNFATCLLQKLNLFKTQTMRKLLLLTIGAGLSISSYAQSAATLTNIIQTPQPAVSKAVQRTTAVFHDSLVLTNLHTTDSLKLYYASSHTDSGFFAGTNGYGFTAFAERYDFNGADSSIEILGVLSLFGGTVNPASTKTLTFRAWNVGPVATSSRPTLSFSGFPGTQLDSVNVGITHLGITDTSVSYTAHYFTTPTAYLTTSFFVGYSINYNFSALAGDTIGLYTSKIGQRTSNIINISGGDTTVNDVNVTFDTSFWYDNGYNLKTNNNYLIFPIVNTKSSLGFKGVTRNDFTFFGNYPNPAVNSTNIKFSLAKSTDVTIVITDMSGRTINTITQSDLGIGEHIIPVETNNMAPGNYIYAIHTAAGDGIASTMTVVK